MTATRIDGAMVKSASIPDAALTNQPVFATRQVASGGLVSGGGDLSSNRTLTVSEASRAEAMAGTASDKAMTPRRVTEAVAKAGINEQTVSYELVLTDEGKIIEMNVGAANTLTIPANADVAFEVGTVIMIVQIGTGQVNVIPAGGVVIRSSGSKTKTYGQYSSLMLYKRAANLWVLTGDLA